MITRRRFISLLPAGALAAAGLVKVDQAPADLFNLELSEIEKRWLKIIYSDLVHDVAYGFFSSVFACPENGAMVYFNLPRAQQTLRCVVPSTLPEEWATYPNRDVKLRQLGFRTVSRPGHYDQTIAIHSASDLSRATYLAFRTLKDVWGVRDFSYPAETRVRDSIMDIHYRAHFNYEINSKLFLDF